MTPTEGRELRDRNLALFEGTQTEFLEHCRTQAMMIARRQGSVSINDIRLHVQIPPGVHPSVLGAVFRPSVFRVIGYTEAIHPAAHSRIVRVFALKDSKNGQ